MDIRTKKKGNSVQVSINGPCTIYSVKALHEVLKKEYDSGREIIIDASGIDEMDTAAFQLLLCLKKDSVKKNRKVTVINHSDALLSILDLYGAAGLFHDRLSISRKQKKNFAFSYGTKLTKFE